MVLTVWITPKDPLVLTYHDTQPKGVGYQSLERHLTHNKYAQRDLWRV